MEQENIVYVSAYTPPSDSHITYVHLQKKIAGEIRDFQETITLPTTYTLPWRARAVIEHAANLLGGKPGTIYFTVTGGYDSRPNLAYLQQYIEIPAESNPTYPALKTQIIELGRNHQYA